MQQHKLSVDGLQQSKAANDVSYLCICYPGPMHAACGYMRTFVRTTSTKCTGKNFQVVMTVRPCEPPKPPILLDWLYADAAYASFLGYPRIEA